MRTRVKRNVCTEFLYACLQFVQAKLQTVMKNNIFLFLVTLLIWSCQVDDDNIKIKLSTEDNEIIEKAYSKDYLFPDDFNYEKNLSGSIYYENTVSIRTSNDVWIELHTNDKSQAKIWSEISSTTSAYYRDLILERETGKYFEFKRVY